MATDRARAGGRAPRSGPKLVARLAPIVEADLDAAAHALPGRRSAAPRVLTAAAGSSPMLDPRARIAFTEVPHDPVGVRDFIEPVHLVRVRAEL